LIEYRKIHEQILDLNQKEKSEVFNYLENCYNSPCRFYKYDIFYDNCATKVRDVIFNAKENGVIYDTSTYCCQTFRQLLKPYVSINYWLDLGINILLGREADRMARVHDYMFLPDYIMSILDDSQIVTDRKIFMDGSGIDTKETRLSYLFPWAIILILIITSLWIKTRRLAFIITTFVIGINGLFILTVSLISENSAFANNFNVYWTLPALVILFVKKDHLKNIIEAVYITVLILLLLFWNKYPQDFSIAFIPWIILLITIQLIDIQIIRKITTFVNRWH